MAEAHSDLLPQFPDALAASLGQLMVRFQALEATLVLAIGRFLHPGNDGVPPQLTMSLLYELSFASLVKVFATIPIVLSGPDVPFARLREDNDETRQLFSYFTTAAKLCSAAEERRNQLMHSNWLQILIKPGDESVLRAKMRTLRKKGAPPPLAAESIETVSEAIATINAAITETFSASATLNYFLFPNSGDAI